MAPGMKVQVPDDERCSRDLPQNSVTQNQDKQVTGTTTSIILAIAEEELRIGREEFDKQIEHAHFKRTQSRAADDAISRKTKA